MSNIIHHFDEIVRAHPDSIAIEHGEERISYAALSSRSRSIAQTLREKGVMAGTPVVLFAKRRPDFVAAILGILRAGGYYIPIDERVPRERVRLIVEAARARHAVATDSSDDRCPPQLATLELGSFPNHAKQSPAPAPRQPNSLAYVMFTSGSTGAPKGVMIPDRGVVRLVKMQTFVQLGGQDALALISNLSFDAATFEIWGALLNGGRLVIPDESIVRDLGRTLDLIQISKVTAGFFNATVFRQMLAVNPSALKGMHTILVGGENVPDTLFVKAAEVLDYRCLVNGYGPTENTTFSCCHRMTSPPHIGKPIPIGRAIARSTVLLVDEDLKPVPSGETGEILVGGDGMAAGYLDNPEETKKKFVEGPDGGSWYRTGDLGYELDSGEIVFAGRRDQQVKIRGFRIELTEIEAELLRMTGVKAAAVLTRENAGGLHIVAYVESAAEEAVLKDHLRDKLPDYMVPDRIVVMDTLPVNENGKIDRLALQELPKDGKPEAGEAPTISVESRVAEILADLLEDRSIDVRDRFFDFGMNSLLVVIFSERLSAAFNLKIRPVDVFDHPTVVEIAVRIAVQLDENGEKAHDARSKTQVQPALSADRIAIVGMAGRFPRAADVDEFWARTVAGKIDVSELGPQDDGLMPFRGVLEDVDRFDAGFFGVSEREAGMLDPQQRVLLELAQHALEHAAVDPRQGDYLISVYAACGPVESRSSAMSLSEQYERSLATSPDFTATRISYRLDLKGESITVQTGCSSSLVAVHMACQSLLAGKVNVSLAGGVSIASDQTVGYGVEEGMITSPSGKCSPFDVTANGTLPGSGAGIVVLMRLEDAVQRGLPIQAVILGSAINNDGSSKVGFMAPSPSGQSAVIAEAHANAKVTADTIAYVETHGTGTKLGDAVEIEGLARAFGLDRGRKNICALGSVKANYGHLDRAAGIVGLIRAALSVRHGIIPPMAGFTRSNAELLLEQRGFCVPTSATAWPGSQGIRRAGVSSFGVGGTNAHVILEQAPTLRDPSSSVRKSRLITLSGHTPTALEAQVRALSAFCIKNGALDLNAIARTLSHGRRAQKYRTYLTASDQASLIGHLDGGIPIVCADSKPEVIWAFPGHGDSRVEGFPSLYESDHAYRAALDECADILMPLAKFDLRGYLFGEHDAGTHDIDLSVFQPAMFAVQWAMAQMWLSRGVRPSALIGHSLGEIVAAALAGVFSLHDALAFIAQRGRLMQATPSGAVLSVSLSETAVKKHLLPDTVIAVINGSELVSISGPAASIKRLERVLSAAEVRVKVLAIPRAVHSPLMRSAAAELLAFTSTLALSPPRIPILSNVTGTWANDEMATAGYWARHVTSPVQFSASLVRLRERGRTLTLVVGPGEGLHRLLKLEYGDNTIEVAALSREEGKPDQVRVQEIIGRLWAHGADVDPAATPGEHPPRKLALPPSVFDHSRRWPDQEHAYKSIDVEPQRIARSDDAGSWLWENQWKTLAGKPRSTPTIRYCLIGAGEGVAEALSSHPALEGANIVEFHAGQNDAAMNVTDILWWPTGSIETVVASLADLMLVCKGRAAHIWILTTPGQNRLQADVPPYKAITHAFVRAGALEYPHLEFHSIDINTDDKAVIIDGIAAFLTLEGAAQMLRIEPLGPRKLVPEHSWPDWRSRPLRNQGCYVITGGLGRVARSLMQAIASSVPVTLILTGRRPRAAIESELVALRGFVGAYETKLEYHQVDCTNITAMTELFTRLRDVHGRIDGVIHAAGYTDTTKFKTLDSLDAASIKLVASAKLLGVLAIEAALAANDADFIFLCSSLSTFLGGIGFGAYIAANAAMDDFASMRWQNGDRRWVSVGWDSWTDGAAQADLGPSYYALNDEDGVQVFPRLLAARTAVILVSTGSLPERAEEVRSLVGGDPGVQHRSDDREERPDPKTAVEAVVLAVLGRLPSDRDRDLRKDGVESLTILQIATRLRQMLKVEILMIDVMRNLSINGLCRLAEAGVKSAAPRRIETFHIVPVVEADHYPTSSVQRRWLALMPEGYGGLDVAMEVNGEIDSNSLVEAIEKVILRHSGLRTCFKRLQDRWVQHVKKETRIELLDLSNSQSWKADLEDKISGKLTQWFSPDADTAPFEVIVAALPAGKLAVAIHAHHILFDGWSSSLFLHDVAQAAAGRLGGRPLQYVDYAAAQTAYASGQGIVPARRYWQAHFAGAQSPTRFFPGRPALAAEERDDVVRFIIPRDMMAKVAERAQMLHSTNFTLLMAAYGLLVSGIAERFDLIVGTTAAGRPTTQTDEIVGVFVNPLPIRIAFSPDTTLFDYLSLVNDVLIGFHTHQHYPLEDLVNHVDAFKGRGLNEAFHCYLLYQNYLRPKESGLSFDRIDLGRRTNPKLMREFEIILEDVETGVSAELWYKTSRFSSAEALSWRDEFIRIINLIAAADGHSAVSGILFAGNKR